MLKSTGSLIPKICPLVFQGHRAGPNFWYFDDDVSEFEKMHE